MIISTKQILLGTGLLTVLSLLVQWLLAMWIKTRLEKSIQHEYDKSLEDYRFQQLQRKKAETVSRLFAKWIKYGGAEFEYLNKNELINFYEELNQMSLEISLWIDEKILIDIMACLEQKDGAKDIRTLAGQVRKLILNNDKDGFDALKIVLWPNLEMKKKLFVNSNKG